MSETSSGLRASKRQPVPGIRVMNLRSLLPLRDALLAACVLLLAACATPPSRPQPPQTPTPPPATPQPPRSEAPQPASPSRPETTQSQRPAPSDAKAASKAEPKTASGKPVTPAPQNTGGSAMTDEERKAALDEQFVVSLGEFDKRLAREQVEIEKQREAGSGGGRGGSRQGNGEGAEGESGGMRAGMPAELPPGESGDATQQTAVLGGGGPGAPTPGPRFPPPAGTPDGADDDIVARQLREAAESEKDPELRAKLWEEYRKYKSRK